jgi:hypothetical protein
MGTAWIIAVLLGAGVGKAPVDRRPGDEATLRMDQRITYPDQRPPWNTEAAAAAGEDRARDPRPGRGPRKASAHVR